MYFGKKFILIQHDWVGSLYLQPFLLGNLHLSNDWPCTFPTKTGFLPTDTGCQGIKATYDLAMGGSQ